MSKCEVAEFITYNKVLTETERLKVEGYLAQRWGLTDLLASSHPYKSTDPRASSPVITINSPLATEASKGMAFAYQLSATGAPTSFGLYNAPTWLSIDTSTGAVTGTPNEGGVFKATISASNALGSNIQELTISVGDNAPFEYSMDVTPAYSPAFISGGYVDITNPAYGSVSGSTTLAGYGAPAAFDNIMTNNSGTGRWIAYQSDLPNVYVQYQLDNGEKKTVSQYTVMSAHYNWVQRSPKTWKLQGSNDGSAWTDVDVVTNEANFAKDETRTYTVDSPGNYEYYKFLVSATGGSDTHVQVREIQLLTQTSAPYQPDLSDWHMMVRLSESNASLYDQGFRYTQFMNGASDLRFQTATGVECKYEISTWNPQGESIIWVNIPTLSVGDKITMRWGNPNAAPPAFTTNGEAWPGYVGVYHLDEPTGDAFDSSIEGNDLPQIENHGYPSAAAGIASGARHTDKDRWQGFGDNAFNGTLTAGQFTAWRLGPLPTARSQGLIRSWWGMWLQGTNGWHTRLSNVTNNGSPNSLRSRRSQSESGQLDPSTDVEGWRLVLSWWPPQVAARPRFT